MSADKDPNFVPPSGTPKSGRKSIFDGIQPPTVSLSRSVKEATEKEFEVLSSVVEESNRIALLKNEFYGENPTTLRDVISTNKLFYRWSCITGIIMPDNSYTNSKSFFFKYIVVKFRIWSFYLHFALWSHTILMTIYLIYFSLKDKRDDTRSNIVTTVQTVGTVFQNILLYPAIVYLRREMSVKREIDLKVYTEAMNYAIKLGRYMFILFTILQLTFVALEIAFLDRNAVFSIFIIVGIIFFFTPANFFLLGLLTFLIFEQRLSLHTMETVKNKIVNKTFSYTEYFQSRESIDKRDRETPINWLIFASLTNTAMAILLLFVISEYHDSLLGIFGDIFFILSGFGRQIAVLIVILLEIVKVNEIADQLLKILVKSEWIGNELTRLNLYVAMKDCPMGSTIFYFRPSKFQLTLQIGSSIIGMGIAIFWAIVFA